ncbi:MAG TPA: YlxR family protein [Streptosporangiaceae bacterium]|nr:YlxR family protein [Streptosporangiaceae bacterium]
MVTRDPRQARHTSVIRTCLGCGARAAKYDLLRVVAVGNEIVPDPRARRPGRGAYLHPSQECFKQAQRRRAFARALRQPGPLGTDALAGYLAESGRGLAGHDPGAARTAGPG